MEQRGIRLRAPSNHIITLRTLEHSNMTASRYQYFSIEELSCNCGKCQYSSTDEGMDPEFMKALIALRTECGFPLIGTSARRCSDHDKNVSSSRRAGSGPHTTGKAMDIRVNTTEQFNTLLQIAFTLKRAQNASLRVFSGIGIKIHSHWSGRFVHLDTLTKEYSNARPNVWTYP